MKQATEQSGRGYRFLEEVATADIAFHAWGADLSQVFTESARATTNVMVENLQAIQLRERKTCRLSNEALDLLLFDFLQEVIYFKDADQLILLPSGVGIARQGSLWILEAELCGEVLDPERHIQRADVKAVTLHQFKLEQSERGWRAEVILDI